MKGIIKYSLSLVALLILSSCDKNEHYINEVVSSPADLMLDVAFNADGTAYDRTGTLNVASFTGSQVSAQYNSFYERYSARFNGTAGLGSTGSGYYRASYASNDAFKRGLADGFSFEVIFSPGVLANSTILSTYTESLEEGFGLELRKEGELMFTLATKDGGVTTGLSRQDTGHAIAVGGYYHVVGVWDHLNSLMKLYINGNQHQIKSDKAASLPTGSDLLLPTAKARQWVGIGAMPLENANYAARTFNGEIVMAKIYNKVLKSNEIKQMFYTLVYTGAPKPLSISEIAFRTPCKVAHGNRYHVYGKGFAEGDSLLFTPKGGGNGLRCEAALNESADGVSVVLPETLETGIYDLSVFRADKSKILGTVNFEISATPDLEVKTGILAHRCVHGNGIPENSIAGLKETQRRGYFGAEFDVFITADSNSEDAEDDGEVVVCHDVTYNDVNLETSPYSAVSALRLSNGEPFPTLDSFLKQGKEGGVHLTFEIKNHSSWENTKRCADRVIKLVADNGYTKDMFTVTSFNLETLKYLRSKVGKDNMRLAYHGEMSPEELDKLGIDGIACAMKVLSEHPDWVKKAHDLGMTTTVWTPDSVEDLTTFIGLGVTSVTVNDVALADKCLKRTYLSAE